MIELLFASGLFAGEAEIEAEIASEVAALDRAWRAGQLVEVVGHAEAALDLIEASACPMRADAAVIATIGGLASTAHNVPSWYGYHFWVASQVDAEFDVLPPGLEQMIEFHRSEPGANISEDYRYARSRYLDASSLERECSTRLLESGILQVEPESASAVIVAVAWQARLEERRWEDADLLYAFPAQEGEQLLARLREDERLAGGWSQQQIVTFDPCVRVSTEDAGSTYVCRDDPAP